MNNYKYHFHFITFDIETFNLENFKYNFVNMTAFRMVDIEHPSVKLILKDMEKFQPMGQHILNKTNVINVSINYFSQNFKLCYLSSTLLCLI
jgi:ionotropic kainate glutamate receptor 2